jgi:hypothetical protein
MRQVIFDQSLQKLVSVYLPDQGPCVIMVGDIGRVLRQDIAHDLIDGVIALLL